MFSTLGVGLKEDERDSSSNTERESGVGDFPPGVGNFPTGVGDFPSEGGLISGDFVPFCLERDFGCDAAFGCLIGSKLTLATCREIM